MSSFGQADDLVKDYLLFRGFTNTFRALENEIRLDKDKGFQVDKVMDELLKAINSGDIHALVDYYRYLDVRFFSRLDVRFQKTVKKFELCLLRHYLVHAIQHKKKDRVVQFFDLYGTKLHGQAEWSQWFALPYLKSPANDPTFETFFSKQWIDNYTISLHNFLALVFQHMPLPTLLAVLNERSQHKTQQAEIDTLQSTIAAQRSSLEAQQNEIARLEHEINMIKEEMKEGITLIRRSKAGLSSTFSDREQHAARSTIVSEDNSASCVEGLAADGGTEESNDKRCRSDDDTFMIVNQKEFAEHASGITHAKFSYQDNLVASCDMDNVVRIWSYKEDATDSPSLKLSNNNQESILAMEWDSRTSRYLFLGTSSGLIRVHDVESQAVAQEFLMDEAYPWVTQIVSSPTEPIFICSGIADKRSGDSETGALVAWNLRTLSACGSFRFNSTRENGDSIQTMKLNHNGQMLAGGDTNGSIYIFDIRTMKPIIQWKAEPSVAVQFSFDENSVHSVDTSGELSQWSLHKPGDCIFKSQIQDFKTEKMPHHPSEKLLTSSASVSSTLSQRSSRDIRIPLLTASARSQRVAFNADTNHLLTTTVNKTEDRIYASIYPIPTEQRRNVKNLPISLNIDSQPISQNITVVDWANSSNACLTGDSDGVVRITTMLKPL